MRSARPDGVARAAGRATPFAAIAVLLVAWQIACGSSSSDTASDASAPAADGGSDDADGAAAGDAMQADVSAPIAPRACRPIQSDHIGVYRPSTATFYVLNQRPGWIESAPPISSWSFGQPGWKAVVGDWDGNGSQTHGAFDGAGHWYLSNALGATTADVQLTFGQAGDVPLTGDWTGEGTTTIGVFRPSTEQFLLETRSGEGTGMADVAFSLPFVQSGDVPLAGDWNGDGITTVGVFRPSSATFLLRNDDKPGPPDITVAYGAPGDVPVVGDWDGDGKWTIGVQRGIDVLLTNTFVPGDAQITVALGNPGDQVIVGNWNGSPRGYGAAPSVLVGFFPLAADYQPSSTFGTWLSRKANSLIRYPAPGCPYAEDIGAWTTAAESAGLSMIRAPNSPASLDANLPSLLAWDMIDEPEGSTSASQVASTYASLKAVSPSRAAFVNFAGPTVLSTGGCNGPGDGTDEGCYPAYIATEDWVSEDIYPVASGADIATIGQTLDKLRRWAGGRPLFAYAQTSDVFAGAPTLTPDQLRGEMWEAIVHGVRGIFFFAADHCAGGPCTIADGTPGDVAAEMAVQNGRIASIAAVLQGPIDPDGAAITAPSPLEATWRAVGSEHYFIVLNDSPQAVTRSLSICGVATAAPVTVVGEGRTIGAGGAPASPAFSDAFGPYEAHVYLVHALP